jgi:phosphoribosyl-dephospho-CoA transferase
MPCAGTLKNLYANFTVAPGTGGSGKKRHVTVVLNGSPTSLVANVIETATTGNDTTHTVSVAAGDLVSIQFSVTGSPASSKGGFGVSFVPTVAGNQVELNSSGAQLPSTTQTNYTGINGQAALGGMWGTANTTGRCRILGATDIAITALYVGVNAAPNTGKSWTCNVCDDTTGVGTAQVIADAATSAGAAYDQARAVTGSFMNFKVVPSGTPDSPGSMRFSYVYRNPTDNTGTYSDTSTLTSALLNAAALVRSEATTLTNLLVSSIQKVIADNATLTTASNAIVSITRTILETVTHSEVVNRVTQRIESATATLTTNALGIWNIARTVLDTVTHSTVAEATRTAFINILETITTTISEIRSVGKLVSETVTNTASEVRSLLRDILETVTHSEAYTLYHEIHVIVLETLTATTDFIKDFARSFAVEVASLTTEVSNQAGKVLDDTLTTTTSVLRLLGKTIDDAVTSTDSAIRSLARSISETLTNTTSVSKQTVKAVLAGTVSHTTALSRQIIKGITEVAHFFAPTRLISAILNGVLLNLLWRNRTKPTSTWAKRTLPTTTHAARTKPTTPWDEREIP